MSAVKQLIEQKSADISVIVLQKTSNFIKNIQNYKLNTSEMLLVVIVVKLVLSKSEFDDASKTAAISAAVNFRFQPLLAPPMLAIRPIILAVLYSAAVLRPSSASSALFCKVLRWVRCCLLLTLCTLRL